MKHLALALLLTACGTETRTVETAALVDTTDVRENVRNSVSESKVEVTSVALANRALAPACTEANETQLAYLIDEGVFIVCAKSEWVEIDIKGKDGSNGTNGIAGVDGINGTNGVDGAQGVKGDTAGMVLEWIHPVTGKTWRYHGTVNNSFYSAACTAAGTDEAVAEYRIPYPNEVTDALLNGLQSMNGPLDIWANDKLASDPNRRQVWINGKLDTPVMNVIADIVPRPSQYHAMYCVQN